MKKQLRITIGALILVATIAVFANYIHGHPTIVSKLGSTNPLLIGVLILIYIVFSGALALVLHFSVRLFDVQIDAKESVLLNSYSSLVNFFGPGQSGPAFRGLYLKKRHGLGLKKYLFATLLYYGFYAVISACLLAVGSRPWWQTLILVTVTAGVSIGVIRWYTRKRLQKGTRLQASNIWLIGAATALQIAMQIVAFYLELRSINPHISISQVLTYTGAANFALFVSLTPGAIGIREAFLVFTGQLHHITNSTIVAANVIDRGAYLLLLGILFLVVIGMHANDKLRLMRVTSKNVSKS